MTSYPFKNKTISGRATVVVLSTLVVAILVASVSLLASALDAPSLAISQVPLQVAVPVS